MRRRASCGPRENSVRIYPKFRSRALAVQAQSTPNLTLLAGGPGMRHFLVGDSSTEIPLENPADELPHTRLMTRGPTFTRTGAHWESGSRCASGTSRGGSTCRSFRSSARREDQGGSPTRRGEAESPLREGRATVVPYGRPHFFEGRRQDSIGKKRAVGATVNRKNSAPRSYRPPESPSLYFEGFGS